MHVTDMRPCEVDPDNYHLTIFMTSQPSDPRPDPFVQGGGNDRSKPLSIIPAPDKQTLHKELDAWRELAAVTLTPKFQASLMQLCILSGMQLSSCWCQDLACPPGMLTEAFLYLNPT